MWQPVGNPLVYCVDVRSADTYNSGYVRFQTYQEGDSKTTTIDGMLTDDYFIIGKTLLGDSYFVCIQLFTSNIDPTEYVEKESVSLFYKFETETITFDSTSDIEYFASSLYDDNDYITLKVTDQIVNEYLKSKICDAIEITQKSISPY